jgi:hypothetical protein
VGPSAHATGPDLSVRELLATLACIGETVLIYPSTGGRPKARRTLTETSPTQNQLIDVFDLHRWAPRTWVIHPNITRKPTPPGTTPSTIKDSRKPGASRG